MGGWVLWQGLPKVRHFKHGPAVALRCGQGHSESWGKEPGSRSLSPDQDELSQGLGRQPEGPGSIPRPGVQAAAPSSSLTSVQSPSKREPVAARLGQRESQEFWAPVALVG